MHEFSLVKALLEQVQGIRQARGMDRVVSIDVSVGEMAGVETELFREAYDLLVPAIDSWKAKLTVTELPLEARCRVCGGTFRVARLRFICPACGAADVAVVQGDAVILQRVTFETASR